LFLSFFFTLRGEADKKAMSQRAGGGSTGGGTGGGGGVGGGGGNNGGGGGLADASTSETSDGSGATGRFVVFRAFLFSIQGGGDRAAGRGRVEEREVFVAQRRPWLPPQKK